MNIWIVLGGVAMPLGFFALSAELFGAWSTRARAGIAISLAIVVAGAGMLANANALPDDTELTALAILLLIPAILVAAAARCIRAILRWRRRRASPAMQRESSASAPPRESARTFVPTGDEDLSDFVDPLYDAPGANGPRKRRKRPTDDPAKVMVNFEGEELLLLLHYRDVAGDATERHVTVRRLRGKRVEGSDKIEWKSVYCWCHMRQNVRSFLFSRIQAAADPHTGEVILDLPAWLLAQHAA